MRKVLLFFIFTPLVFKAQQILPLNVNPFDVSTANHYIRDLGNELPPFEGTYKASFNGNEIIINIKEGIRTLFSYPQGTSFYKDALFIKYSVTNSSGNLVQTTIDKVLQPTDVMFNIVSMFTNPQENSITFYYGGTNCGVGNGGIILKKISDTQLNWSYHPNDIILTSSSCPGNPDTTIYLPETDNLVFTKQ